jgi:hypothetical protein
MLILTCIVRLLPPAPLERNHRLPSVANPGAFLLLASSNAGA